MFYASSFYQMMHLVCVDPIKKISIANVFFKYVYKLYNIENRVVLTGTTSKPSSRVLNFWMQEN